MISNPIFENKNMSYSKQYLNTEVSVVMDRMLGTKHPKHGYTYPVNYGYIPNTKAPDGEELDAYVLGVSTPVKKFTGSCIAIIHRLDDDDDKLIVVKPGQNYSDTEIREFTQFQEQYFKSRIVRGQK